ncbi:hypothetical protein GW17_00062218 [Ensete ventricosum]|nr:hypothetical protein GW17_00062218 [Ensete ventricosum]
MQRGLISYDEEEEKKKECCSEWRGGDGTGEEGPAVGDGALCFQVQGVLDLVESVGENAEAEDEPDEEDHQHQQEAEAAGLARAAHDD